MSRHTAAPWTFLEEDTSEFGSNASMPLTICGPDHDDLASVYSSADATVNVSRAEAIANARLIAACPEIAKALAGLVEIFCVRPDILHLVGPHEDAQIKAACDALNKAGICP